MDIQHYMQTLGRQARAASRIVAAASTEAKNAALIAMAGEIRARRAELLARDWLARLGLPGIGGRRPGELSGGQAQRVAIARALIHAPSVIFADEPTGNLDGNTGAKVVEIMLELNREFGTTTVLVTHDMELARRAARMIRLANGLVVEDTGAPVAR